MIGAATGIGLIFHAGSGVTLTTPAIQTWTETGQVLMNLDLGGNYRSSGSFLTYGTVTPAL